MVGAVEIKGFFVEWIAQLRIVREEAPSNKTSTLSVEKYGYEHLGGWYIKSTLYTMFLN